MEENETSLANLEVLGHISDRIQYDKPVRGGFRVDLRINNIEIYYRAVGQRRYLGYFWCYIKNGFEITGGGG